MFGRGQLMGISIPATEKKEGQKKEKRKRGQEQAYISSQHVAQWGEFSNTMDLGEIITEGRSHVTERVSGLISSGR